MKTKIVKITVFIVAVMIVLAFAGQAGADIIELDLFSLGCPAEYDINSPYWQTDFDLGVEFIEISHVYMDWSGEITAGLVQHLDPQTLEPIGDPLPIDVGIYASMGHPRRTEVFGGGATYPDPEPFDYLSEIPPGTSAWSDLLDGQGTITVGYEEYIILFGEYVEHGSIALDSATLVVEGIIVPEPATLLLLALGGLIIQSTI